MKKEHKCDDEIKRQDTLKVLPDDNQPGITAYFIKYYLLMSASGSVSYPVFMMADPTIPEGEFRAKEVPFFGYSVSQFDKGYIVFCDTTVELEMKISTNGLMRS